MQTYIDPAALDRIASLKKSDRMPVMFLGHGSPMNALHGNDYYKSWQVLGAEFGSKLPRPQRRTMRGRAGQRARI